MMRQHAVLASCLLEGIIVVSAERNTFEEKQGGCFFLAALALVCGRVVPTFRFGIVTIRSHHRVAVVARVSVTARTRTGVHIVDAVNRGSGVLSLQCFQRRFASILGNRGGTWVRLCDTSLGFIFSVCVKLVVLLGNRDTELPTHIHRLVCETGVRAVVQWQLNQGLFIHRHVGGRVDRRANHVRRLGGVIPSTLKRLAPAVKFLE
mmetsp:Transcript_37203/g.64253  ORF Transcript_37203/g.64253 Transcript_37203/m.64253 type:complete len:206 (+) Transcript_37203:2691-3308(+)